VRLVLISDTHCRETFIDVPSGDILIHAGDFTINGTREEFQNVAAWLKSLPHQRKIFIAGNHDWMLSKSRAEAERLLCDRTTHYLENSGIMIDGVTFWGSPITPESENLAFMVARGTPIKKFWDLIPRGVDVLITHGPPMMVLDQVAPRIHSEHLGCEELLIAVQRIRPKVHVFGHIHGGYGSVSDGKTRFFNASLVDEAYRPVNQPFVVDI
jgi:Icc-related predicted phosphoesterase